jgi:hypothetical protein
MKAKINGMELEGTETEIANIIGMLGRKIETPKVATEPKATLKDTYREIAEKIKKGVYHNITEGLEKEGFKPYGEAWKVVRKFLGDDYQYKKRSYKRHKKTIKTEPTKTDKRTARARFISNRANVMMARENISREKAYSIASQEWTQNGRQTLPPVETAPIIADDTPIIVINEQYNKILLDMIRHLIANKTTLKMYPDGQAIGIEDGRKWHIVLTTIVSKNAEIMDYFNVKGRLQIEEDNRGYETLTYKEMA